MLLWAVYFCAFTAALLTLWQVIGGALYDMGASVRRRDRQRHPHARRYRTRPLVSALVMVGNPDDAALVPSVQALQRSRYRKLEIIVVGYGLSYRQHAVYRRQVRMLSGNIRYHASKAISRELALNSAIQHHVHGEILVCMDSRYTVDHGTISEAVVELQSWPEVHVIVPHRQLRPLSHFVGLVELYVQYMCQHLQKADTVMKVYNPAWSFRIQRRESAAQNSWDYQVRYSSRSIVVSDSVRTFRQLLMQQYWLQYAYWHRMVMIVLTKRFKLGPRLWMRLILSATIAMVILSLPLLCLYFCYLALCFAQPMMLFLLLGSLSAYLLFAIIDESHMSSLRRVFVVMGIPVMYGVFVFLGLWQYIVVAGAIGNGLARKLTPYYVRLTTHAVKS